MFFRKMVEELEAEINTLEMELRSERRKNKILSAELDELSERLSPKECGAHCKICRWGYLEDEKYACALNSKCSTISLKER